MTEEHKGIEIPLSSGFVVSVKPLPPYYLDFIDDKLPLLKYPNRKLHLLSGDDLEVEYKLPERVPEESNTEEYELYISYKAVEFKNVEIAKQRDRMRSDFLLSNCVSIVSGPISYETEEWVIKLEAAIPDYKVPTHPGKRMLAFLKSNVITSTSEKEIIVSTSCFKEVSLQGIVDALQGFQDAVGRETAARSNIQS